MSSIALAAAPDLAGVRVELEVGEAEDLLRARRHPAQKRPQAGEQLLERERLREVVVRAGVEAGDAALHLGAGGQHQHGHAVSLSADPAAHLQAVDARHQDVEDHGVGLAVRLEPVERVGAVHRELDLVALELEGPAERVAHGAFVVDDQHFHARKCAAGR